MRRVFDGVAGNNPSLNKFDLSYTVTSSMKFGLLYPVQCDECVAGDVFKLNSYVHCEVMPMVAPVMSDIQMFCHAFFVPFRILYGVDNSDGKSIFEKFITGGESGDYDTPLPKWTPSFSKSGFSSDTIWDYIGNPVTFDEVTQKWSPLVPGGLDVSVAPRLAYNKIYNEFYRDENLVDEVDSTNEDLLHVAFRKDYFTSALEQQQRGTAPALPVNISGTAPVSFSGSLPVNFTQYAGNGVWMNAPASGGDTIVFLGTFADDDTKLGLGQHNTDAVPADKYASADKHYVKANVDSSSFSGSVSGSSFVANTFNISDLRLAFAVQRMLELAERAGYRYTEWLSANFGVSPTDARLDRPEYIGGALINVTVSPVIQNSGTEKSTGSQKTPQGNKVGIGSVDTVQHVGNYRVLEPGVIMTLVSIRPKPIYQQGIDRQWLRQDRFSYYNPALAYLSEQGIYNAELYIDGTSGVGGDNDIFGYQAHWNEMRCKQNRVAGAVRTTFDYWTLARKFSSRPALNQDFIEIDDSDFNKIFAVQDEDTFIVSWSNIITAYRPIPAMGVPGRVDHVYGGI